MASVGGLMEVLLKESPLQCGAHMVSIIIIFRLNYKTYLFILIVDLSLKRVFRLFFEFVENISPFCWATDTHVFDFW